MDTGIEPAPIAIVGMACRFPGDASDPDKLWQLLAGGKSAFKEIPQDRFNLAGFYHPDPKRSDSVRHLPLPPHPTCPTERKTHAVTDEGPF